MSAKKTLMALLTGALALTWLLAGFAFAAEEEYNYVGVKKCKMCHKKEKIGAQYLSWSEGVHAGAYATLASEESKTIAAELGLGNPQEEADCLKCHVTAFPVMADLATQKITLEEGVSCESCHGPGSGYKKKKTMKGIYDGAIEAASVGLLEVTEETCTACHNSDSPTFKEFDYEKRSEEIAHPYPENYAETRKAADDK